MIEAYIPSPSFSEFHIGPLVIHMYAICILIGIFIAMGLTIKRWGRHGGTADQIIDVSLITIPFGILGGRLYHIITTPERFFGPHGDPMEMIRIWNGGLGIWGAVVLGGLAAWAWCRHKHYPIALLADAVAPGLLIAQAVGRLGNWFNQELFGGPTTLPWGLKVGDAARLRVSCYHGGLPCPPGTLFHPTFLYELLWDLLGAIVLLAMTKSVAKHSKAGTLFVEYVIWYTIGRAYIETLRIDYAHYLWGARINVWVAIAVAILALGVKSILQRKGTSTEELSKQLQLLTSQEARS